MGIINTEEMAGIWSGDDVICIDCVKDSDLAEVDNDEIIYITEIENADTKLYLCDRCKNRM